MNPSLFRYTLPIKPPICSFKMTQGPELFIESSMDPITPLSMNEMQLINNNNVGPQKDDIAIEPVHNVPPISRRGPTDQHHLPKIDGIPHGPPAPPVRHHHLRNSLGHENSVDDLAGPPRAKQVNEMFITNFYLE
jgi:hypothetical protein